MGSSQRGDPNSKSKTIIRLKDNKYKIYPVKSRFAGNSQEQIYLTK